MTKRYQIALAVFAVFFSVLLARLFYIQIFKGPSLSQAASSQRLKNYQVEKSRGDILDRNGIRFTNRSAEAFIVLKPAYIGDSDNLVELCNLLETDCKYIKRQLSIGREPVIIETERDIGERIADMGLKGVSVIHTLKRYDGNSLAAHVLGYLNGTDYIGETGIEKFYNDVLEYDRESMVAAITDARNNVIEGMGYRMIRVAPRNRKLNVKLTLDYHIQKIVEDVMEKNGITGAVVVEDVTTGDIVAIASKLDFNQNGIAQYIDSPRNELFNRAVASYNLGSVFKIVNVAAALENGVTIPDDYYCRGYIEIGDRMFKCASYDRGGHGILGLESAFAQSCNTYFINLGIQTGYKSLIETAGVFGFGKPVGLGYQGVSESPGNLPTPEKNHSYGDIANISIGQGEIMGTPLQVADMVATIANGGIKNSVNIVDSIVDEMGNIVRNMRVNAGQRVVQKKTADRIKKLMEEVINSGTGSSVDLKQYGGAAGKTGSAETGQFLDGSKVVHAWFAGYFPRRNPSYSVAVFIENGKYGGQVAAPAFEQIAREVMKKGF